MTLFLLKFESNMSYHCGTVFYGQSVNGMSSQVFYTARAYSGSGLKET